MNSTELKLVEHYGNMDIFPGQRVEVYDHIDGTYQKGTVTKRYGLTENHSKVCNWRYPDLVDVKQDRVRFNHLNDKYRQLSKGHFTYAVKKLTEQKGV